MPKSLLGILVIFLILGSGVGVFAITQAQNQNPTTPVNEQLMKIIKAIEFIVLKLKNLGLDMSEPLKLLENAKNAMASGNYLEAKNYAIRALRTAGDIAKKNLNYTPPKSSIDKAIRNLRTIITKVKKYKPEKAEELMKHLDIVKDLFSKGKVPLAIKELRNIGLELRKIHEELSKSKRIHAAKCIAKRLEPIIEIIKRKAEEKGINASELINELRKEISKLRSEEKLTISDIVNTMRSVLASPRLLDEVYNEIQANAELIKEHMYKGVGIEKHVSESLKRIPKTYRYLVYLIPKRPGLIIEFLINTAKKIYNATKDLMSEEARRQIEELINNTCKVTRVTKFAMEMYVFGNGEKAKELALRSRELALTNIETIDNIISNGTETKAEYVILILLKAANEILVRIDNLIIKLSETIPGIGDTVIVRGIVLRVNNESKKALIWGIGKSIRTASENTTAILRPRLGLWIINYSLVSEEANDLKPGYIVCARGEITKYEKNIPVVTVSEIKILRKQQR